MGAPKILNSCGLPSSVSCRSVEAVVYFDGGGTRPGDTATALAWLLGLNMNTIPVSWGENYQGFFTDQGNGIPAVPQNLNPSVNSVWQSYYYTPSPSNFIRTEIAFTGCGFQELLVLAILNSGGQSVIGGCTTTAYPCNPLELLPSTSGENVWYIVAVAGSPMNNSVLPNVMPDLNTFANNYKGYGGIPNAPIPIASSFDPNQVCDWTGGDPFGGGAP